ncbi:hypothetical protein D3C81_2009930 [compost metagenome]
MMMPTDAVGMAVAMVMPRMVVARVGMPRVGMIVVVCVIVRHATPLGPPAAPRQRQRT